MNHHAVILALLFAALFGLSTPATKALLGTAVPAVLVGLLYCGAGAGVALLRRMARPWLTERAAREAPLSAADAPWLAGAIRFSLGRGTTEDEVASVVAQLRRTISAAAS